MAMGADGQALHENEQVEEVWTGTTFAIASHMLSEGMRDQAFHTARVFTTSSGKIADIFSGLLKPMTHMGCTAPACT